ncbi:endonuclease domain-containing protein [Demequina sp. NBRC 110056]|uniref:endonuclease domain-containing protein n=1 Tax=Demequina sp. NBRC 110056 TaxID=1570345 RepID=UPI0013565EAA|nr:DUF559 domain-containing protein [Demequina sp. NBRC 110056]
MLPGFYCAAEHIDSFAVRAHAAVAWAHPEAALIGASAVAKWGLGEPAESVCVAVPWGTQRVCPPWLRLRRIERVPRSVFIDDVRTVDAPWAIATAYGDLAADARDAPVYRAVQTRLVAPDELLAPAQTLARMRHRRSYLRLVAAVRAGSESHLETLGLRDVFTGTGFDAFIRQHCLRLDGQRFRLDMYHPTTRTAVELDGRTHADPRQRERDIARDAILLAHGIATVRFSYRDITERRRWCRDVVRRVLATRSNPALHAASNAA